MSGRAAFLKSLTEELRSQATRVRDLIQDAHWLSDGHHKEALLAGVIRRHLPASVYAGRGFVVSERDANVCTREQDILVVDTRYESPVFFEDGLVITLPGSVLASVSVKTTMQKEEVLDSVRVLASAKAICAEQMSPDLLWCGSFHFTEERPVNVTTTYDHIAEGIRECGLTAVDGEPLLGVDLLCSIGERAFVVENVQRSLARDEKHVRVRGFGSDGLAAGLFVAQLSEHVARRLGGPKDGLSKLIGEAKFTALEPPEAWVTG